MTYERQILEILTRVGEKGISVKLLAMHVYNLNTSLFASLDMDEVKNYVRNYVIRNTKSANSLLEKADRWGYYRLNTSNNADANTLMLNFKQYQEESEEEESDTEKQGQDLSLDLFA